MSDKYLRNEMQQLLNSIGTEVCWGWSPAVDFVSLLEKRPKCTIAKGEATAASADFPSVDADTNRATRPAATAKTTLATSTKSKEVNDLDALLAQLQQRKAAAAEATELSSTHCDGDVSILLAGACDIRHIFRTLSSLRAAEASNAPDATTYHFYVYEPSLRLHCRHLFFLQWLLDSMFALEELEERTLMFLDVYGNAVMRESTSAQVRNVVQRLRKAIEDEASPLRQIVSLQEMKYKERDFVESQLTHWSRDASVVDIATQWTQRVRQEMAERYDNRDNIIDWDFVFRLTEYTNLLKFAEYRAWRNTGVAFDVSHINPRRGFSYEYTVPNKTLCLFSRSGQGSYTGDIKNGPFFAFGAVTDNVHIRHRTTDGTCKYGNGVVSLHNVRAWLYTLMTGMAWPWADHAFAWDDAKYYNYLPPGTPSGASYAATFPKVRVHVVGLDFDRFVLHRMEDKVPRIDAAFFGTSCTQLMTPAFFHEVMHAATGVVVAETAKFIVDAEDVAKDAYVRKLEELAGKAGWAREEALTAMLHEGTPEPQPADGSMSAAQRLSQRRYDQPSLLAFVARATK